MAFQQYTVSPWLSPVRVVSTTNVSGTYFNGTQNNGVGATLTIAASSLTVDSVVLVVGDRLLLSGQTAANQNGIYVVNSIGATVVLQRSFDMQCAEQMLLGQYVTTAAGTTNAGTAFCLIEPLPAHFGVNNMVWASATVAGTGTAATKDASDNGLPTVASVSGATVANALAVFADTAGTVKAQTVASTLGFGLTLATGNLAASAGNVSAGSSGNAGTLTSFPATAANGSLIVSALNAGGAFNTTIRNSTMGQSTVYSLGDIGAATGGIPVSTGAVRMKMVADAAAAGGSATQNFVDAFCTAASVVVGSWQTQTTPASILTIVPGVGSFDVVSSADAGVGTFNYVIMK